jgi:hypothetical protein
VTGNWPSVPRDEALLQLRAAAPEGSLHPTKHVPPELADAMRAVVERERAMRAVQP